MIVTPYKQAPVPPTVALLTESGDVIDEHGTRHDPAEIPAGTRVWGSYDTVRGLVLAGVGEALCWNGEEIRWRHGRLDARGWRNRPGDVSVIRIPLPERPSQALAAIVGWRNWLRDHGACPLGTTGSASMSLLRARLDSIVFCSMGEQPPLLQTMGGRIELGPAGAGSFRGPIEQWDMPAAYASTLGALAYGGRWWRLSDLPVVHDLDWWHNGGRRMLYVHATVRLRGDGPGPLIRRPRRRTSLLRMHLEALTAVRYPSSGRITGVWTWDELLAAERHGARIVTVHDGWVHLGGRQLFGSWWEAVQDGRDRRGLMGALAKMTGNALWGRFCMDVRVQGDRAIRRKPAGRRRLEQTPIAQRSGGPTPAHDLADTVSGRVRARLYEAIMVAGDDLLSAHTDGVWLRRGPAAAALEASGWRRKQQATRIDVIDPQTLRYWPTRRPGPEYVVAGRAPAEAPDAFARLWKQAGYDDDDDERGDDHGMDGTAVVLGRRASVGV